MTVRRAALQPWELRALADCCRHRVLPGVPHPALLLDIERLAHDAFRTPFEGSLLPIPLKFETRCSANAGDTSSLIEYRLYALFAE